MPPHNNFQHQKYSSAQPTAPYEIVTPVLDDFRSDGPEGQQRVANIRHQLQAAGVCGVYLVHGTFTGEDASGMIREIERYFPRVAGVLHRTVKQLVDRILADTGNFSERYRRQLQEWLRPTVSGKPAETDADPATESESVPADGAEAETTIDGVTSAPSERAIAVKSFHWSSENLHLGRAEAAVRLLEAIAAESWPNGSRLLFLAHSHGGNVLALLTNLIRALPAARDQFFRATRGVHLGQSSSGSEPSHWLRVQQQLAATENSLRTIGLDIVTLGTPIRYGWDTNGCGQLLHFVHHRRQPGIPPYLTTLPGSLHQLLAAEAGDYIQHMAIAGTNLTPYLFAWRSWQAELRLNRLLQSDIRRRDLWRHLKCGQRVPHDGRTLLVHYGNSPGHAERVAAGHAIYTHSDWMLFHLESIVNRFYKTAAVNP